MFKLLSFLLGAVTEPPAEGAVPGEATPSPDQEAASSIDEMVRASSERILSDTPVEELVGDDAPYRDVKPLRDEIAAAREQYGPAAEALAQVPEGLRDSYLAFGPAYALAASDPSLGADIGFLQATYPNLAPEDRQVLDAVIGDARLNPQGTAELLREAAGMLRGDDQGDDGDDGDESRADQFRVRRTTERPMTVAESQRMRRGNGSGRPGPQHRGTILRSELGYSPDSKPGSTERADWNFPVATASWTGASEGPRNPARTTGHHRPVRQREIGGRRSTAASRDRCPGQWRAATRVNGRYEPRDARAHPLRGNLSARRGSSLNPLEGSQCRSAKSATSSSTTTRT
jgi:hypothetical protein